MSIHIDRSKLKKAFPDRKIAPAPIDPNITNENEIATATVEARLEAAAKADRRNYVVNYIVSNAENEKRVEDVLAIKPLLSFLRQSDFTIAHIACNIGEGKNYPDDVLHLIANAVRSSFPNGEIVQENYDKKQMLAMAKVFRDTLKAMDEEGEKLKDLLVKIIAPQVKEPVSTAALANEEVATERAAQGVFS